MEPVLSNVQHSETEIVLRIAHELRTPLTGIKWALEMLLQGKFGELSEDQKKMLALCQEGNARAIAIVSDILRPDRVGTNGVKLKTEPTDIVNVIQEVIDGLHLTAITHQVTVHTTHDGTIPPLMVDREMMRFVFQNLIDNAIQYSNSGGVVDVRVELASGFVECSITDRGIGIPAVEQSHIFSRYFRANNATSIQPNGNGVGLSLVRGMVEAQGGRIWFTSEEDKGTTFFVSLAL